MTNVIRFAAVLLAFVAAVSGVVWTTASSERQAAERDAQERKSTDDMLAAFLHARARSEGTPSRVDPTCSTRIGTPTPRSTTRSSVPVPARTGTRKRSSSRSPSRSGSPSAGPTRRGRRHRPHPHQAERRLPESALIRNDLVDRFQRENAELLASVEEESAATYRRSVERAVALIVLLSAVFGAGGGLLMLNLSRKERRRRATESPATTPPARVRRDASGDRERGRGTCARQAPPRALSRRQDRRAEPKQQPEQARGCNTGPPGSRARRQADRLLPEVMSRSPARAHPRAGGWARSRCSRARCARMSNAPLVSRHSSAAR